MPLSFTNVTVSPSQDFSNLTANPRPGCTSQLLFIGLVQYRVTLSQVPASGDSGIVVQKFNGTTWTTIIDDATKTPTNMAALAIGTVIYILGSEDLSHLKMYRFDTSTDSFLSTSPNLLMGNASQWNAMDILGDGTILVISNLTGSSVLGAVKYDPSTNTWGTPATVATPSIGPFHVVATAFDAGAGLVLVFFGHYQNEELRCISVDSALTVGTQKVVIAPTLNGNTFDRWLQLAPGTPVISGGKVCIPYLDPVPISSYAVQVNVARATPSTAPTFATEAVQDVSLIDPAWVCQTQNSSVQLRDLVAIDQGGTLYVFYVVDNGDLESSSSLAACYYNSSTAPGVWSAPSLLYTGPLGSEAFSPWANLDAAGNIAVLVSWIDQDALFGPDPITGLLTKYFYQGATPVRFGNEFR